MEIWLVRHTRPAVERGTCYGWTDVPLADSFEQEAELIRSFLPNLASGNQLWCSPLSRCTRLASFAYVDLLPTYQPDLREMHFGEWENRHWNTIPEEDSKHWMDHFVEVATPSGESYVQLQERVWRCLEPVFKEDHHKPLVVISHGGVMRCLLATLMGVPLVASFEQFKLDYGAVVRLNREGALGWQAAFIHQAQWIREGE
jgi:alpha-ribazole phosphatase